MLKAVIDHGGFAQAAEVVHKSQSSINHAVHKLQDQLGLRLLEVVGRKAQLTEAGALMLRRAEQLLEQAAQLEAVGDSLAEGTEAEIRIAIDEIYPYDALAVALAGLAADYPNTRVELLETVLSGGPELLIAGEVDLLVAGEVPAGFLGDPLMQAEFVAVARADHPLHQIGRGLTLQDLSRHRQLVVRDSGRLHNRDMGWLGAEQRWTVSHVSTSVDMVQRGMGFAWLPASRVASGLASGVLAELPLTQGVQRYVTLYLSYADRDRAGPAACRLAELLHAECAAYGAG